MCRRCWAGDSCNEAAGKPNLVDLPTNAKKRAHGTEAEASANPEKAGAPVRVEYQIPYDTPARRVGRVENQCHDVRHRAFLGYRPRCIHGIGARGPGIVDG